MAKTMKQLRADISDRNKFMLDKLREVEQQIQDNSANVQKAQEEMQQRVAQLQRQSPPLIGYAQALRELLDIAPPKNPARPLDK